MLLLAIHLDYSPQANLGFQQDSNTGTEPVECFHRGLDPPGDWSNLPTWQVRPMNLGVHTDFVIQIQAGESYVECFDGALDPPWWLK